MTRCLIIEDEPLAQELIIGYIRRIPQLDLVRVCGTATEAFKTLHEETINLLFLDIQLPAITGLDFMRSLTSPPAVIFTTAYPEYALASYEVHAVDYLVKPITFDRFLTSVNRFLKLYVEAKPDKSYTFFKVNGKFIKLEHEAILYARCIKDYIVIHTIEQNYITYMTMKYLDKLLPASVFLRVHRSYLINKNKLTSIAKHEVEIGKDKIPIGKNYRNLLM